MKRKFLCALLFSIAASLALAQQPPDWATRTFNAPADKVYAAGLRSIQQQKHEITRTDDKKMQATFHVSTTAWSWGYNMMLNVDAIDATHSRATVAVLSKSGGNVFSWGSGKKEVRKILGGIDAEIAALNSGINKQ